MSATPFIGFSPTIAGGSITPRAQIWAREYGASTAIPYSYWGDHRNIELSFDITRIEDWSNDTLELLLNELLATKKSATLDLDLKRFTPQLHAMLFMSKLKLHTADALAETAFSFANVKVGDIINFGARNVVVTPTSENWELGTHYEVDSPGGWGSIKALPQGLTTFAGNKSAPEITAAAEIYTGGLMDDVDKTFEIVIRQINKGPKIELVLPKVMIGVREGVPLAQDGSEFTSGALTGRILADYTKPQGLQYGTVTRFPG